VPDRPLWPRLVVVVLLALCAYLLWNWSLSANHDTLALVAGVTLIPLLIALAWLFVLAVARLLAHVTHRSRARSGVSERTVRAHTTARGVERREETAALGDPAGGGASAAPSSKLAA
jgi:hypothetical protein